MIVNELQPNLYSYAALFGAVQDKGFLDDDQNLRITFPDRLSVPLIQRAMERSKRVVVLFSMRTAQVPRLQDRLAHIVPSLPATDRLLLVAGGSHPTGDPLSTLKLGMDLAFVGEAEASFTQFLERVFANGDWRSSPGTVTWQDPEAKDAVMHNPTVSPICLDEWTPFSSKLGLHAPLEISRSCPFNCTFCAVKSVLGPIRHRSPDLVVEHLRDLVGVGICDVRFVSPDAFRYGHQSNVPRSRLDSIQYLLENTSRIEGVRDLFFGTFPGEVRPESVTDEVLQLIRPYVTNKKIALGVQSGSNSVLRKIRRGHSAEDGLVAVRRVSAAGFEPLVDFIFGLPDETENERIETFELIDKMLSYGARVRAHVFMPLPGTKLWRAPPGSLDRDTRRRLSTLARLKHLEGNFETQERYALEAADLLARLDEMIPLCRGQ